MLRATSVVQFILIESQVRRDDISARGERRCTSPPRRRWFFVISY
jgi:hypothetical protein